MTISTSRIDSNSLRELIQRVRRNSNGLMNIYQARDFALRILDQELLRVADEIKREEEKN